MKIVSVKEYYDAIKKFVNKHEVVKVITSPMVEEQWYKDYLTEDGAFAKEVNRILYEYVEVEVKGLKCEVEIKLLETEWFDSDNGYSIYVYERA